VGGKRVSLHSVEGYERRVGGRDGVVGQDVRNKGEGPVRPVRLTWNGVLVHCLRRGCCQRDASGKGNTCRA